MTTNKKIALIISVVLLAVVLFIIVSIRLYISSAFSVEFRNGTAVIKQSPVSIYLARNLCSNSYLKELFKSHGSINAGLLLVVTSNGSFSPAVIMTKNLDELMVVLEEEIEASPGVKATRAIPKGP